MDAARRRRTRRTTAPITSTATTAPPTSSPVVDVDDEVVDVVPSSTVVGASVSGGPVGEAVSYQTSVAIVGEVITSVPSARVNLRRRPRARPSGSSGRPSTAAVAVGSSTTVEGAAEDGAGGGAGNPCTIHEPSPVRSIGRPVVPSSALIAPVIRLICTTAGIVPSGV